MTVADEINQLLAKLPPEKSESVLQFARFLSEQANDQAWENSLAAATSSKRFRAELSDVEREIAQGAANPLSPDDL